MAQEITLSAKDGDQQVVGTLTEYDGEFYRVETEFGPVTIDARTVTCAGPTCPEVSDEIETFNVMGDPTITLPLIEAFALFQGGDVSIANGDPQIVTVTTSSGDVLAQVTIMEGSVDGLRDESNSIWFSTLPAPDPSRAQIVGLDAVILATSDVNPVSAITLDQIRAVLNGSITNWKDLGGGDIAVNVHAAEGDAGFQAQVTSLGLEPSAGANVTRHARMKDAVDAVANDPFGLALVPFSGLRTARAMGLRDRKSVV